jgi:hypothetical protein
VLGGFVDHCPGPVGRVEGESACRYPRAKQAS